MIFEDDIRNAVAVHAKGWTNTYDHLNRLIHKTVLDNITNRTDTAYETDASNIVWRVETSTVVGPSTNSLTITRTQHTGLSDSCRRHTVTLVGRARRARRTETLTTYDPSTGIETTLTRTDGQTPAVTRSLHGVPLEQISLDERRTMSYDAFGRNVFNVSESTTTGTTNWTEHIEYDISGNAVRRTVDYGADGVAVSTAEYDMLNHEVRRMDALGHVTETAFDALVRISPVNVFRTTEPLPELAGTINCDLFADESAEWESA